MVDKPPRLWICYSSPCEKAVTLFCSLVLIFMIIPYSILSNLFYFTLIFYKAVI